MRHRAQAETGAEVTLQKLHAAATDLAPLLGPGTLRTRAAARGRSRLVVAAANPHESATNTALRSAELTRCPSRTRRFCPSSRSSPNRPREQALQAVATPQSRSSRTSALPSPSDSVPAGKTATEAIAAVPSTRYSVKHRHQSSQARAEPTILSDQGDPVIHLPAASRSQARRLLVRPRSTG